MLKKLIADIKMAFMVIVTENISALRILLRNIVKYAFKSVRSNQKS